MILFENGQRKFGTYKRNHFDELLRERVHITCVMQRRAAAVAGSDGNGRCDFLAMVAKTEHGYVREDIRNCSETEEAGRI